jgi:6-phosphogluconolactonase
MLIQIFPNVEALTEAAARIFIETGAQSIQERDRFSVALSGGSTPQPLFKFLAKDKPGDDINWEKIHFFWSDERSVPAEHPDSNYGQAFQSLLSQRDIPPQNIHRIKGELDPQETSLAYQKEISDYFNGSPPIFDLILLGMGDDGHTASLFPDTEQVKNPTKGIWVAANYVPKLETWRITFTPWLINNAEKVIFLVAGQNKAQALREVLEGSYQPSLYPTQLIKPKHGELIWLLDKQAGKELTID